MRVIRSKLDYIDTDYRVLAKLNGKTVGFIDKNLNGTYSYAFGRPKASYVSFNVDDLDTAKSRLEEHVFMGNSRRPVKSSRKPIKSANYNGFNLEARRSYGKGNIYFTTYPVWDTDLDTSIGAIEYHYAVENPYYVAWVYDDFGANKTGRTKAFDTEEECLEWIGEELASGTTARDKLLKYWEELGYDYKSKNLNNSRKPVKSENKYGADVDRIYEKQLNRIKKLRTKGYSDDEIDDDKIVRQTKEDMRNVGKIKSSRRPVKSEYDPDIDYDAEELALYIKNTSELYHGITHSVIENLKKKARKGVYDKERAVDAWMYVADAGAKMYDKELGSGRGSMTLFTKDERRKAAEELARYYEENVLEGLDNVQSAFKIVSGKHTVEYSKPSREELENVLDDFLAQKKVKFATDIYDDTVDYILTFWDEQDFKPRSVEEAVTDWYNDTKKHFPEDLKKISAAYHRWIKSKLIRSSRRMRIR